MPQIVLVGIKHCSLLGVLIGRMVVDSEGWETEFPAFDFTASPGAEEWQIDQAADGRAVYSTVRGVGDRITVEFQKWDW